MLLQLSALDCAADLTLVLQAVGRLFSKVAESDLQLPGTPIPQEWAEDDGDIKFLLRYHAVRDAVSRLLNATKDDRQALVRAFTHDSEFQNRLDDDAFGFKFGTLPLSVFAPAQSLLLALYNDILAKNGFRGLNGQGSAVLDRHTFERAYRIANRGRDFVCSGCLGKLERRAGEFVMTDCEHFFPQSAYPALVIHPLNLVILCTTCNQRAHRNTLPIGSGVGAIRETFIPYIRAGLEELRLSFRPGARVATLTIEGNGLTPHSTSRVANFDRVYLLSSRWTNDLEYLHTSLMDDIYAESPEPRIEEVTRFLQGRARLSLAAQLRTPDAFLRSQYAKWILENRLDEFLLEFV